MLRSKRVLKLVFKLVSKKSFRHLIKNRFNNQKLLFWELNGGYIPVKCHLLSPSSPTGSCELAEDTRRRPDHLCRIGIASIRPHSTRPGYSIAAAAAAAEPEPAAIQLAFDCRAPPPPPSSTGSKKTSTCNTAVAQPKLANCCPTDLRLPGSTTTVVVVVLSESAPSN